MISPSHNMLLDLDGAWSTCLRMLMIFSQTCCWHISILMCFLWHRCTQGQSPPKVAKASCWCSQSWDVSFPNFPNSMCIFFAIVDMYSTHSLWYVWMSRWINRYSHPGWIHDIMIIYIQSITSIVYNVFAIMLLHISRLFHWFSLLLQGFIRAHFQLRSKWWMTTKFG